MKVFITGSTGYLGHELAMTLAHRGTPVHAMVRDTRSNRVPKHENIRLFQGNLEDQQEIQQAMEGCTHVIHSAAFTNMRCKEVDAFYNTNVEGTENILQNALSSDIERFVFTSSLSVFGPSLKNRPITENQPRMVSFANPYELTKSMAEDLVRSYNSKGLPSLILNVTKIYGPGLKSFSNGVNRMIEIYKKSPFLVVPSKTKVVSNYVFIKDVVDAHIAALTQGCPGENYIIGGENVSYDQLFDHIRELTNSQTKIVKVNYSLSRFALSFLDRLKSLFGAKNSIGPEILDALFTYRLSTSEKAGKDLNYSFQPFKQGLEQTVQFLNAARS